eukprot:1153588-Pelagomonas_calceolata.AAC.2
MALLEYSGGRFKVPHFTTFEAQPHPNVKPMAYANSFMFGMAPGYAGHIVSATKRPGTQVTLCQGAVLAHIPHFARFGTPWGCHGTPGYRIEQGFLLFFEPARLHVMCGK